MSPICGLLADRTSSRMAPFLSGLGLLAVSMIVLTIARSTTMYLVGRILQGVSSTFVQVIGLAMVVDTVERGKIGRIFGYISAAISLGFGVGPILAGAIYEAGGYYAAFGMAFGLIGVDLILRLAMIEKRTAKKWLEETHTAMDESGRQGFGNPITARPEGENSSLQRASQLALFTLFRNHRLIVTLWGNFVQAIIIASLDATLPILVSRLFRWNSLGAGLIFLPNVLPSIADPFWGYLTDRYGVRLTAVLGFLLMSPVLIAMRFVSQDTATDKVLLCGLLFPIGVFLDLSTPALLVELEELVSAKEEERPGFFGRGGAFAQVFGLYSMSQAAGMIVGSLWGGFVTDGAGWGTMGWSLALLSACTAMAMSKLGEEWLATRPASVISGGELSTGEEAINLSEPNQEVPVRNT
ncbi:vesicular amine transporter [Phlyctema vagabunda]|uniref:Vesicular amine transporter n=1 Tax=Phlyctema vagabunda TaxID=108571 RepID=A0ABR4P996_9HELO